MNFAGHNVKLQLTYLDVGDEVQGKTSSSEDEAPKLLPAF